MIEHSKTPWRPELGTEGDTTDAIVRIWDANNRLITGCYHSQNTNGGLWFVYSGDTEYLFTAVNSHDQLVARVAELEEALRELERWVEAEVLGHDDIAGNEAMSDSEFEAVFAKARKLLDGAPK